ncbi:hypothetical protein [Pelomonas sp. SE-A7]|uniref:hypothetical protein n=1 Tax=Pelomonas sp. SE-A7 TaxID=3054953 RepID=UPI00259CD679|nr:hypothetical protein [Pelomonas sp. SE-A7]MDM4765485.1 hypothetical protein [Pelomonas sp. SE-A7]
MRRREPVYDAQRHERWHMGPARWIKLAACVLAMLLMHRLMGNWAMVVVISSPLWGIFLASEILGGASGLKRRLRALYWRDREGVHYEFKGVYISVEEDVGQRWIRLEDLGRALGEKPNEMLLRRLDAEGLREIDRELYVLDDLVLRYLAERSSDRALSLRGWVQRTIWHPARQRR